LSDGYANWLHSEAAKAGISRADCEYAYLTPECPERADGKVTAKQLSEGAPKFYRTLRESRAKIVVAFGP